MAEGPPLECNLLGAGKFRIKDCAVGAGVVGLAFVALHGSSPWMACFASDA